jgi:hypothetical protein
MKQQPRGYPPQHSELLPPNAVSEFWILNSERLTRRGLAASS